MSTTSHTTAHIRAHWNGKEYSEMVVTTDGVNTTTVRNEMPYEPTRGYLTHVTTIDGIDTIISTAGWFHAVAGSNGVARRRIGGRNVYMFTTQGRIIRFVEDRKAI